MPGTAAPASPARRRFFRSLVEGPDESDAAPDWRRAEGLSAGPGDVFWAVWACDDVVLVLGDEGTIFRHAGQGWTRLAAPVPVPIHAVWGPREDALCAVGWMGAILASDGAGWHLVRGCVVGADGRYAPTAENAPLFAVTGDASGRLWAVGDHGTILTAPNPFGPWEAEPSGTRQHLRAVAPLPDGRLLAAGADGTVLLRDPGGHWQALDCPLRAGFQAVLPLGAGEALLAGGRYFAQANGFRGDLLRWRDGAFEVLSGEAPLPRLRALTAYRGAVLAVGDKGGLYRVRGDRVTRLASPTRHDLLGVTRLPGGEAVVVGDFGTVLASGTTLDEAPAAPAAAGDAAVPDWSPMASGTDRQLWGAWHDPHSGVLYACGEEGTVLRCDGDRWEALPPVGALGLHDLCDAGDGGLLAAGQLGEIHHFDGTRWRKHFDLCLDVTILALWSDGAGNVFAAGDEGLILRWDGATWERETSGTKSALYGLWGMDDRHLLAVGDFGLILRWNGRRWDEFHAGTESFLFDVWGSALDDIYVVGLSGTIGHFDGKRWTLTPARVRPDLLALAGGGGAAVAVGAAGTALFRDGDDWRVDDTGFDGGLRAVTCSPSLGTVAVGDGGTILRRARRD